MCRLLNSLYLPGSRNTLVLGLAAALALSPLAVAPRAASASLTGTATSLIGDGVDDVADGVDDAADGVDDAGEEETTEQEVFVPMEGVATNACIPPGTYVDGQLRVVFRMKTSATKVVVHTCTHSDRAKILVPGVGTFKSDEHVMDEVETDLEDQEVEFEGHGRFYYRMSGESETYTMTYKYKIKVDLTNNRPVARSESIYMDCYTPCCGG